MGTGGEIRFRGPTDVVGEEPEGVGKNRGYQARRVSSVSPVRVGRVLGEDVGTCVDRKWRPVEEGGQSTEGMVTGGGSSGVGGTRRTKRWSCGSPPSKRPTEKDLNPSRHRKDGKSRSSGEGWTVRKSDDWCLGTIRGMS